MGPKTWSLLQHRPHLKISTMEILFSWGHMIMFSFLCGWEKHKVMLSRMTKMNIFIWWGFNGGFQWKNGQIFGWTTFVTTLALGLQRCGPRVKSRSHISCPRECGRVWGNEPPHSQVSSHFGSWSPDGLPNLQRIIAWVKTHWIEEFFISLKIFWIVNV